MAMLVPRLYIVWRLFTPESTTLDASCAASFFVGYSLLHHSTYEPSKGTQSLPHMLWGKLYGE